MAFGTLSKIFRAGLGDALGNVTPLDIDGTDTLKAALYGNTGTPDQNVASALTAYNTGQWVVANEVSQAGQWDAGGVALTDVTLDRTVAATVFLDSNDPTSGASATLLNVYGCLVYDDTVTATPGPADQGICFNSFGGPQSVTAGSFSIIWPATGILRYTV